MLGWIDLPVAHCRAALAGGLAMVLACAPAGGEEATIATWSAVDRQATRAAAEQFLSAPSQPIVLPEPKVSAKPRTARRFIGASREAPETPLILRARPADASGGDPAQIARQRRLVASELAAVNRRIDSLPRVTAADRAADPVHAGPDRARAMTLDLQRRSLTFTLGTLRTTAARPVEVGPASRDPSAGLIPRSALTR